MKSLQHNRCGRSTGDLRNNNSNKLQVKRRERFNSLMRGCDGMYPMSIETSLPRDTKATRYHHRRTHSEAENNVTETVIQEYPSAEFVVPPPPPPPLPRQQHGEDCCSSQIDDSSDSLIILNRLFAFLPRNVNDNDDQD